MSEIIYSFKPLLAVLVSLVVFPIIFSSDKSPNVREAWTFAAAGVKFLIILSMLPGVLNGAEYAFTLFEVIPGVAIAFRVDGLGMLFALVASFLWIITSVYSLGYMRAEKEHSQTRYFGFFALSLSATIGVAFSANLLTMYLFYEMLSLSTYPLVTHHQDGEARSSGRKYLLYIMGASIALALPAMLITFFEAGTLDFSPGGVFDGTQDKTLLVALLLMFVFGFAKAGIMPFHSWLPAAMVAPTPVSALLHAVAVVKVGVFSIVRVLAYIFGLDLLGDFDLGIIITVIASITILTGSLIALSQDNLKRRLAFSTISQLSYIILGISLLTPAAVNGGLMHIVAHAFSKITLFFCAGAIYVAAHKKNVSEMSGLGRTMPFTFAAFGIAALGMIGVPPVGGFVSKWLLLNGALDASAFGVLFVLLASTMLNAAYFAPVVYKGFFGKSAAGGSVMKEAPLSLVIPLALTAILSVAVGFFPEFFLRFVEVLT
jgi:multicomponent Na+:H+ antiporter subunit D